MDEPLADIVERIVSGDTDAFEIIVERYQRPLWMLVASMAYDRTEAEDLVQRAFLRAFSALDTYDTSSPFWPWLKALARNLVVDHLRGRSRERRHLDSYREQLCTRAGEDDEADRERRRALEECTESLGPESRGALELRYARGLGFAEIGRELNRTAAAAQKTLSRLRLTLKDCVQRKMGQYGAA